MYRYRCKTDKLEIYPKDRMIQTIDTQKCIKCKNQFEEPGTIDMNICRDCNLRYIYHIDHIEIQKYKYDPFNFDDKFITWQAETK